MKISSRCTALLSSSLCAGALFGCGSAPLAETLAHAPQALPSPPGAQTFALDGESASVEIDVKAVAAYTLHFSGLSGTLTLSPKSLVISHLEVAIDASTAKAKLGMVSNIAKSSQFLDVQVYPKAQFTAQSAPGPISPDGQLSLDGELEIHGTKRAIRIPATLTSTECELLLSSSFSVNRRDYHVESHGDLDNIVGDDVEVRVSAHVPRPERPSSCPAAHPANDPPG